MSSNFDSVFENFRVGTRKSVEYESYWKLNSPPNMNKKSGLKVMIKILRRYIVESISMFAQPTILIRFFNKIIV